MKQNNFTIHNKLSLAKKFDKFSYFCLKVKKCKKIIKINIKMFLCIRKDIKISPYEKIYECFISK